ncbi:MAG: T9SS type A sorting domain-containing protein [Aliifodinibius sp.]|nr:T9SS type A sorting domain-containing protein [Fodinibius sp.]NIV12921.1 T9SS type A sorting domain-containing protein [Fodinibius sp.]NIY26595.1 T9SS type A sorting domain-containing protein [Fodinibius sp.]
MVVIDPDHPDYYYVGTDVGVYVTVNGGMSWSMLGSNLPASGVMDLVLHQPTRTLTAATHGRSMFKIDVSTITAIQDKENQNISADFRLDKIYPNPFNSQVTIEFSLSQGQNVTVDIYDILGRRIANLVDEKFSGGNHQVKWDAQGTGSTEISSGIYLVRISSGNQQIVERIHLVK